MRAMLADCSTYTVDQAGVSPLGQRAGMSPTLNYAFDDGAESVLRSERPFDSRDDVQEPDYPGNLEDPFDDRHTPQHDIELATEFKGVFLRLQEYVDDRGVDELDG